MSKKIRKQKITILIVGEGYTEKAFLQYLAELYITRDMDINVKIESAEGGSPQRIIEKAIRFRENIAYDKCFVFIDNDVPLKLSKTLGKKMKKKPGIQILNSTPCIEGLFLLILEHKNFSGKKENSAECKKIFEENYIPKGRKTDKREYVRVFPREMIEKRRREVRELEGVLRAMGV